MRDPDLLPVLDRMTAIAPPLVLRVPCQKNAWMDGWMHVLPAHTSY
ncbi:hypothetical protein BofuT4_uP068190.1 [Botrytis cinerea T4]|uniref:Uncharacterized protein n=1 Tax=Botryotinia fuckeliana (strain T4) TaxID=999810 RepID=G2XQY6_BOTF4|nr:hypothetical protein BofuT4_uP068190.1 [Botrytis cinerea T4]